jgi:hypothetical protein
MLENLKLTARKNILTIITGLIVILLIVAVISFFCVIFNKVYFNTSGVIDPELASQFGDFFGGYVGVIFSMLSTFLLIYTIIDQFIERQKRWATDNFYRMLEFHNDMVNQLSVAHINTTKPERSNGRRAFVVFKLQIHHLLGLIKDLNTGEKWDLNQDQILRIVYMIFYYGIDGQWIEFLQDKIKENIDFNIILNQVSKKEEDENLKLGRTNQTSLSAYFRNMYNLIKLVDNDKYLSKQEKKSLITIYRAQLSNPELYVLFFNLRSDFGKKWNDKGYVETYELLKNIPKYYCDGYNPEDYYPKIKFEYND